MKIDRLMGILVVLMQKERVSMNSLAVQFEVSKRTISRDIDTLGMAGIPIITLAGKGGGVGIESGYKLDKNILTRSELTGLISAVKAMGSVTEVTEMERTLQKLGVSDDAVLSMNEPIVIDLTSYGKGELTKKIETIKSAILAQKRISFTYYYEKGESKRTIEPQTIVFKQGVWYVVGFCLDRQALRWFRLGRLLELSVGEVFEKREMTVVADEPFATYLQPKERLVAIFEPSEKYKLIEMYGIGSFVEENNHLRFEISYANEAYIVGWLLGFGDKVRVIEPVGVREAIERVARGILGMD